MNANLQVSAEPKVAIDPKIWLDKVRAVPIIGLRLNPTYEAAATILEKIRPVLLQWNKAGFAGTKISIIKEFALKLEREDGFEVTINHDTMSCKFYYLSKLNEKGLQQPSVSYQTTPRPIEQLAEEASAIVHDIASELWKNGNRDVHRIGVVAVGSVDYESMPPGFALFLQHLGKPWSAGLISTTTKVLASLRRVEELHERCHHEVSWDGEEESPVSYALDWQRLYLEQKAMTLARLKSEMQEVSKAAFAYFGKFGLGELDYAKSDS
jgi:hypothetical protein